MRQMRSRIAIAGMTALILMGFVLRLAAQTGSVPPDGAQPTLKPGSPQPVSLPHLYWHLLMYQNHLDTAAAERDKTGENGEWLRDNIQQKLEFTDAEFIPIRESAQRLERKIAAIDAKVQAIIKADRAQYGKGPLPSYVRQSGREKMKALNEERDSAIADEISKLNDQLGPNSAAKLQDYIEKEFSSNVTKSSIQPQLHFPHKASSPSTQHQETQP